MRRFTPPGLLLGLIIGIGLLQLHRPLLATGQTRQVWDVQVGGDNADGTISTTSFWPDAITIQAGDTVRWTFAPSSQTHTVFLQPVGRPNPPTWLAGPGDGEYTFGPSWFPIGPNGADAVYDDTQAVNSGADFAGADTSPYTLTFTKPGFYQYNCLLHLGMLGRVEVVAGGAVLPETTAQAQTRGQNQFTQRLMNFNTFVYAPPSNLPQSAVPVGDQQAGAGSVTVHNVVAGLGFGGLVNALQFLPGDLTVHRGDTVLWSNGDSLNGGHTVTFTSGAAPPDFPQVRPQPSGQPLFVLTADTAQPTGGSVYTGQGYVNSGFLAPGRVFALTIDAPAGTYDYICLIHRDVMKGTITVVEGSQ